MSNPSITLLLVEDRREQSFLFQEFLAEINNIRWEVANVQRLTQALAILENQGFDAILLDLSLPDSSGLETLLKIKAIAPHTPIIILTVLNNQDLAIQAISQGAEDFLVKGQFSGDLLSRAINYAIERQRIKEELRQQIERERLMGRMTERIRQSLEINVILNVTVREVRYFLNTDQVLIYRCASEHQGAIVAESLGDQQQQRRNQQIKRVMDFITQFSPQLQANPAINLNNQPVDHQIESMVQSLLTVPIWQAQDEQKYQLWGQLIAYDYGGNRRWQQWEVEFLTQLANQVAIALKQAELYEQVSRLANQDGLTGLANRRQLNLTLEKEWSRLGREQQPLSLIMCDVDFFGRYNNSLGYLAGDRCLKTIARLLQDVCQRGADLAARFGGEEFLLILPNTDLDGALTVARSLQSRLMACQLPHPQSTVSPWVTLSIGVATQVPDPQQTAIVLLDQVAQAVQQAKKQGRNGIVLANSLGS